jgi:acetolactate synthase-1/3 small subunit
MSPKDTKKDVHTISMLVANKPGVLVRVALVFAKRGYNIDSLVVSPAVNQKFSRMTITASGDPEILEQIIKQTNKLIDVIHAFEHTGEDTVDCELALLKVKYTKPSKLVINKYAKKYHAKVVDDSDHTLIIAQVGTTENLDQLEAVLKKYGIIEIVRTGKVVMAKGREET